MNTEDDAFEPEHEHLLDHEFAEDDVDEYDDQAVAHEDDEDDYDLQTGLDDE